MIQMIVMGAVIVPGRDEARANVGSSIFYRDIDPQAIGSVGLESSSFVYRAKGRENAATTLEASIGGRWNSRVFTANADAQFFTFMNNSPQLGFESRELYLATQDGLLDGHQITLGRRKFEWSKVDESWKSMMSLWSPRFVWDSVYPQTVGMTGLFYTYQTRRFKFLAFGSPIAVPERGTPLNEENGQITSPNPLFPALPSELPVQGSMTQIRYDLLMPAIQDILLRPNFALKGEYRLDNGIWFSLNSGVLPVHMTQLAAEPFVDSRPDSGSLNVYVRPQFPMRNINTAEIGFDDPEKQWSAWMSVSYEQPFNFENQKNWLNPIITPSSVVSLGTQFKLTQNFTFDGGILVIREQPFTRSSSLPDINVDLPSRFPLKQGVRASGQWTFSERNLAQFTWVQDLVNSAHFVSGNLQHRFPKSRLTVGGGIDLMLAPNTKGWVGQFYGDDRLRGWIKYAF